MREGERCCRRSMEERCCSRGNHAWDMGEGVGEGEGERKMVREHERMVGR